MKKFFKLIGRNNNQPTSLVLQPTVEPDYEWPLMNEEEGQLAVDIYQTDDFLVVKSTIAGATADDIEVALNEGLLTIKGRRELSEIVPADAYLYRECYWGRFSRSIVLPIEVKSDKVNATLVNGVLTISLPKARRSKQTTIKIKENQEKDYDD
ncbi:Hsp20/alpha crystallin family protein [Candidatus Falkowbacteria bacterium]|jgi:HSP20 family protein|nr:MAG: Hsp20/alpha crystallin family protein [Candidatus Falkowbacteria bacterium]